MPPNPSKCRESFWLYSRNPQHSRHPRLHGFDDLMITRGLTAPAQKLATFWKDIDAVAWSWDGRQITVANWIEEAPSRGGLYVIAVPADDNGTPAMRRYGVPPSSACDFLSWTRDDQYIVMLCYGTGGLMKLRPSDGELTSFVESETPQRVWSITWRLTIRPLCIQSSTTQGHRCTYST